MKKKYVVMISGIVLITIFLSFFAFPIILFDVYSKNKNIEAKSPEIMILPDVTYGAAPLTVNYKSFIVDFGKDVAFSWDFGDGAFSKENTPIHVYSNPGQYRCTLLVSDGSFDVSDEILINVQENNPPIIKIIVDQASGNRPLTVHFDMDGFDVDGEIVSCEWEIIYPPFFSSQKKITRSEKNFSETFLRSGLYEVKLTVKDDYGNVATDYLKIQVLGHKLELLIGTSLYFIGIFRTVIDLYNNFIDFLTPNQPKTFAEKIISFIR